MSLEAGCVWEYSSGLARFVQHARGPGFRRQHCRPKSAESDATCYTIRKGSPPAWGLSADPNQQRRRFPKADNIFRILSVSVWLRIVNMTLPWEKSTGTKLHQAFLVIFSDRGTARPYTHFSSHTTIAWYGGNGGWGKWCKFCIGHIPISELENLACTNTSLLLLLLLIVCVCTYTFLHACWIQEKRNNFPSVARLSGRPPIWVRMSLMPMPAFFQCTICPCRCFTWAHHSDIFLSHVPGFNVLLPDPILQTEANLPS